MSRPLYAGIDVGSQYVKVVIAGPPESPELPMTIIGTGSAPTHGMRQGYVMNVADVSRCVAEAVTRAAQAAKVTITHARISIGGVSLEELKSTGEVTLTTSAGVVTERDVERVLKESEKRAAAKLVNRTIVHTIPLSYRLDGLLIQGRPQGLRGTKLGVETLIVSVLTQHHDDLIEAVEGAGVEVNGIMASPLAASFITLTKAQKTAGVVLANIGAETLSMIIFDNDLPLSTKVFPIGSTNITNAIALSFQLPLLEAEQMKRGAVTGSDISPKKLAKVVEDQLKEMYEHVNGQLKLVARQRLLPAGIVLTGGGASIPDAAQVARITLKLPAQVGLPPAIPRAGALDDTWSVAYGLCRWGFAEDSAIPLYTFGEIMRRTLESIRSGFRALLP
jgi:cell division protein FtsA